MHGTVLYNCDAKAYTDNRLIIDKYVFLCRWKMEKKSKNYLIKFTFYFGIKWFRPTTPSVQQIDPFLCTHLILIGDCWLDEDARTIRFPSARVITELVALKNSNPDLKILVTFSPANRLISQMVCLHFSRQNIWKI